MSISTGGFLTPGQNQPMSPQTQQATNSIGQVYNNMGQNYQQFGQAFQQANEAANKLQGSVQNNQQQINQYLQALQQALGGAGGMSNGFNTGFPSYTTGQTNADFSSGQFNPGGMIGSASNMTQLPDGAKSIYDQYADTIPQITPIQQASMTPQELYSRYGSVIFGNATPSYTPGFQG